MHQTHKMTPNCEATISRGGQNKKRPLDVDSDSPQMKSKKFHAEEVELNDPQPIRILKKKEYRKGVLLGQGAFGKAFRCKVKTCDGAWKDAVLKTLTNWGDRTEFDRETEKLNFLQGIEGVPILYGRITFPRPGIVMSYNGGLTLTTFMEQRSEELPLLCRIMAKVALILETIHDVGVGHNDLHGANIMIDEPPAEGQDEVPTLIDFGFSLPFGKQLYEEQLEGWESYHYDPILSRDCGLTSAETDIYSFGKLLEKLPSSSRSPEGRRLDELIRKAQSPDKTICPSLESFRDALMAINISVT